MVGDGLSYPVNPDAGGESDWAGLSARDNPTHGDGGRGSTSRGSGSGMEINGFGEAEDRYRNHRHPDGDIV